MKYIFFVAIFLLMHSQVQANDENNFKPWCDTFTAEGLISLAANRIYGNITDLSEEEYKSRSKWVNDSYTQARKHFEEVTGLKFEDITYSQEWIDRCQLKDQIN